MSTDQNPPDPTRPPTNPPLTVGKFINLLAAGVGKVLFLLSLIFAVGWVIFGLLIATIDTERDQPTLGAFGIVILVVIIIVGIGWGLRYILTR